MLIDSQQILSAKVFPEISNINTQNSISDITKYRIIQYSVDDPNYTAFNNLRSTTSIKIREDMEPILRNIKASLNVYGISLACESTYPELLNNKISDFCKTGLEIKLFKGSGLDKTGFTEQEDYFIGPDPNNMHNIIVYGNVKRDEVFLQIKHIAEKKVYDIYDIKYTYNKTKPSVKKIYKNLLNITKLFNYYGFKQQKINKNFFEKSIIEECDWNVFYNVSTLKYGMTNINLLETVYENNKTGIWLEKEKYWDGEKFNDR